MAVSSAIRRAAPLVARSLRRNRLIHHFTAALHHRAAAGLLSRLAIGSKSELGFFPQRYHFSALAAKPASDAELAKVIESEIKCAEECDDHDRVEEIPEGFPFEIEDDKGKNIITLRRKYQDEDIEVIVGMPSLVTGEESDMDDDDKEDSDKEDSEEGGDDKRSTQPSIPLTVRVTKGGKNPSLEFLCTAYPDEVVIDAMSVKEDSSNDDEDMHAYEGPKFNNMEEKLHRAFHKFLEMRGIMALTTINLHEYTINKESREYLHWLKTLKEFVEK